MDSDSPSSLVLVNRPLILGSRSTSWVGCDDDSFDSTAKPNSSCPSKCRAELSDVASSVDTLMEKPASAVGEDVCEVCDDRVPAITVATTTATTAAAPTTTDHGRRRRRPPLGAMASMQTMSP